MQRDTLLAGRFRIVEQIGAGGMGEVYRAHDPRLGRDVAIKVLPPDLAGDEARLQRFEQEARAAAALNHANIMAVYDVGHDGGTPYLVSELLEGQTLRERLARGPLPVPKAARMATQIAGGLAAAHGKGITHRDLKPENLFVTSDGTVKILDFGLAQLVLPEGESLETLTAGSGLTAEGAVLGTLGYMAPEQLRGENVDQRADLFSFGCVLYEMLTGAKAFLRDTPADTITAVMREEPPPLDRSRVPVPPALEHVLGRCLEKRPEDRFSSAHDLALALAAAVSDSGPVTGAAAAPARPRWRRPALLAAALLVVLAAAGALWLRGGRLLGGPAAELDPAKVMVAPFANMTGDPSLEPIGRMAADTISEGLLRIGEIGLVTSPVAGPSAPPPAAVDAWCAAACDRGAGSLITGSYYRSGDALEVRARLVDTSNAEVVYALDSDRGPVADPSPVLAAARERVMGAVAYHVSPLFRGMLSHPLRYEAYREFEAGMTASGFDVKAAEAHFRRVTELEPDCWMGHIRLAVVLRFGGKAAEADAVWARVKEHEAELAPVELLFMKFIEARDRRNLVETLELARRLADVAPHDDVMRLFAAMTAINLNRPRETLGYLGDVRSLDWTRWGRAPQGRWLLAVAALAHHYLGEYEAELEIGGFALELYPSSHSGRGHQVRALAALGRLDELERVIDASLTVRAGEGSPGTVMLEAAEELRAHGHPEEALRMAERGAAWYAARSAGDAEPIMGLGNRAELAWMTGRFEEARRLAEAWLQENPESYFVRGMIGVMAARLGDAAAAAKIDAELAACERPDSVGRALYFRAAIAAQQGEKERAVELLRDAFAKGCPFSPQIHRYVYFEPLHGYPPFDDLISPQG